MTKEDLIKQITAWKAQDAAAFDAIATKLQSLRSDVTLALASLTSQLAAFKSSADTGFVGVGDQLSIQKSQALASLDAILTAAAIPDPVVVPPPVVVDKVGALVPMYIYPGGTTGLGYWNSVIANAAKIPMRAIVNPASGPGTTANPDYLSIIAKCKAAGVKLLGYVSTSYGNRPLADIQADITRWKTLYGITDIFLDEQAGSAAMVAFYTNLVAWIRQITPGAYVTANPGTACDQGYYTTAKMDLILISETATKILTLPAWAVAAPDKYFAAMIYGSTQAQMQTFVASVKTYGLGYIFVTNDTLSNPWDTLPPWFQDMVDRLAALT